MRWSARWLASRWSRSSSVAGSRSLAVGWEQPLIAMPAFGTSIELDGPVSLGCVAEDREEGNPKAVGVNLARRLDLEEAALRPHFLHHSEARYVLQLAGLA